MPKPDLNWLKHYLNFSRKDRNAILILSVLILLGLISHIVVNRIQPDSRFDPAEVEKILAQWGEIRDMEFNSQSLFNFDPNIIKEESLDSLLLPDSVKRNIIRYRLAGGKFSNKSDMRKIYGMNDSIFEAIRNYIIIPGEDSAQPEQSGYSGKNIKSAEVYVGYFDPNTVGTDSLQQFGFNNFQADNLLKYRGKGGSFNLPEDVLKIYGIDTAFFLSIEKNIRIENRVPEINPIKQTEIIIELNSADSAQLVQLRGIGPVFASRILKFRELLGGFYSEKQLLEVYNFPEETYLGIKNNVTTDTTLLRKIRVNFAGYKELVRHPYFNKELVNNIIEFREKNGALDSANQLFEAGLMDEAALNRIKPYLTCR